MTDWDENNVHLEEGRLLLYLDGELLPKDAALVQEHLTACWSCRMKAEQVQDMVFSFIEYRNRVWRPFIAPPPSNEQSFTRRLQILKVQLGNRSWLARLYTSWSWREVTSRLSSLPRQVVLTVAALTLVLIIVVSFIWLDRASIVTASDLLQKVSDAHAQELHARVKPVVYQKIRIRRGQRIINWELWCDVTNARFKQSVRSGKEQIERQADDTKLLAELTEVLLANRMNPQQPLSPASFKSWRESLAAKREDISISKTENGEIVKLRVTADSKLFSGQITEASLVVRTHDWHPIGQILKVQSKNEIHDYELSETAYEVMPLAALTIFAEPAPPAMRTIVADAPPFSSSKKLPSLVELQNAEITALFILHKLKADLGEQIEVERKLNEQIIVHGLVETIERKRELITAIKDIPWVETHIQTFDEASKQSIKTIQVQTSDKARRSLKQHTDAAQLLNTNSFEQRLARYFIDRAASPSLKNGAEINRQVAQFANRIFAESSAAMTNGWALRRLIEKTNDVWDGKIGGTAAEQLREIIRDHLSEIITRNRALKVQLEPVLVAIAGEKSVPTTSTLVSGTEGKTRKERIIRLFEAIEQVNQLTYRLFDSEHPLASSPEQIASLMLGALARLDAASKALEEDIQKH